SYAVEQFRKAFLKAPGLVLRAAAKFWRGEHDAVIFAAAADFAGDEFHRVVGNPADGAIIKAGEGLVVLAIAVGFGAGVQVNDFGTGRCAGERHHAGIAKEVEHVQRTPGSADLLLRKSPVYGVFLEDTHMTESG